MSKPLYSAYVLDDDSRNKLLNTFPPRYKRTVAHHVTVQFGNISFDDIPEKAVVEVVGHVDSDDGIEALVVTVNGSTRRGDGLTYHITWSLEGKYKPVDSNTLLNTVEFYAFRNSIPIKTIPLVVGTNNRN